MKHSTLKHRRGGPGWPTLVTALLLLAMPAVTLGQSARAQFAHASPDPALQTVDVYFGDNLELDDFRYRTGTPFLDVPAGIDILVTIADSNSTSAADSLRTFMVQFEAEKTYHVVAHGFLDPSAFQANPNGLPTSFTLTAMDEARESSTRSDDDFVFRVFNAVPDGPTVDFQGKINGIPGGTERLNIAYGTFSSYDSGPSSNDVVGRYRISGSNVVLFEVGVDFSDYGYQAMLQVFTGSITDRESLVQMNLLPDGAQVDAVRVRADTARAQVIHASPDPAAATVDVYLDYGLLLDDFVYKTGTPFVDIPAGSHLIAVAPATSRSAGDAIGTFDTILNAGKAYHIVAAGVLDTTQFPQNPDGLDTSFRLMIADGALETMRTPNSGFFDVRMLHAAPDAPSIDFIGTAPGHGPDKVVEDLVYGEFSGYFSGMTGNPVVGDHYRAGTLELLLGSWLDARDLSLDVTLSVFSGFLDPLVRLEGWLVVTDGSVITTTTVFGLSNEPSEAPDSFRLIGNYPNPFNPSTAIQYELDRPGEIRLVVHDALGREVTRLVDGPAPAGTHTATWNAEGDVPSGVYFITLSAGERTATEAAVLLR